MKHPFESGETYYSSEHSDDIFVLAVDERPETNEVVLAILYIDPKTKGNKGADGLIVKASNFNKWKKREVQ